MEPGEHIRSRETPLEALQVASTGLHISPPDPSQHSLIQSTSQNNPVAFPSATTPSRTYQISPLSLLSPSKRQEQKKRGRFHAMAGPDKKLLSKAPISPFKRHKVALSSAAAGQYSETDSSKSIRHQPSGDTTDIPKLGKRKLTDGLEEPRPKKRALMSRIENFFKP
jgi:hypothetical protein